MRHWIPAALAAAALVAVPFLNPAAPEAQASHSWGSYHWARTANPFTIKAGDNVSGAWDAYLDEAIADWNPSTVLDLNEVPGTAGNPRTCKAVTGTIQVCNAAYGKNGWLGLASIWASGSHITKGSAKLNDTYYNTATYNTAAWRRLVMCQEIAHAFGLSHQNEGFGPPNLGSCMDYTNDPDGGGSYGPSNEHPNAHDFDQLETIYTHTDSINTIAQSAAPAAQPGDDEPGDSPRDWGRPVGKDGAGRDNQFIKQLGNGQAKITHVFWLPK